MKALILKEIRSFFSSLIGYVVISAFLLMLGLFLWVFPGPWNILSSGVASMEAFFTLAPWVLLFLVPAITMRSFAEERRSGTLELLLTRPLLEGQIIQAKFYGAISLTAMSLIPTLGFVWVLGELGNPQWNLDLGGIWGSYLGLFLLSTSMAAIGVFASAATKQPLVAFLLTMVLSTIGYIGFTALGDFALLGSWDYLFVNLGFDAHYRSLSRGLIDIRDVAYFIVVDIIFLQLARFVLAVERGRLGRELTKLLIIVASTGVLLFAAHILSYSIDVTAEKRHTLTEGSTNILEQLEETGAEVVVTCYLKGEYPASWRRLEIAIQEKLEDFASASGGHLRFQFVDIYESGDNQTIGENEERLLELGMSFTRIGYVSGGGKTFRNVWPAALVSINGKEVPVQFFMSETPQPTDAMIQGSINSVEYQLLSAINRALTKEKKQIAFIEGHGELPEEEVGDFILSLEEDYGVTRVKLYGKLNTLGEKLEGMKYRVNRFDLAIIAKPDSAFSDKDRLILDQFLMAGGRILWMVDPVITDLDSLRTAQTTMAITNELGIYHQLFDYGVRLNKSLVIDPQCAPIAFDAGPQGNQRNMQLFSWYFAPLAIPQSTTEITHPITTNLDPIHFNFVSSIDTVGIDRDIKKTVLLHSSEKARMYLAPVRVSSSIVDLTPEYFTTHNVPNSPFAVLLEGKFKSHFTDILPAALQYDEEFAFRAEGRRSAMIVVADGDICRNKVVSTPDGFSIYPLGYDRYAGRVVYDNKEFLLNAVNHLLDENSMISVRSRAISLRALNDDKITNEKLGWQAIAIALPLLVVLIIASVLLTIRKRKYAY
jgi:ABC-2 type transport system permease protein